MYNNSIDFGSRASVLFLNVPQSHVDGIAYSTEICFGNCTVACLVQQASLEKNFKNMKNNISID